MNEIEPLIIKATELGAIACIMHFNANAREPEKAKEMLVNYISKMTKEPGIIYCKGEVEEPKEGEDGNYSAIAEAVILADRFNTMAKLAIKYAPMAVEVQNRNALKLTIDEATSILLDISLASQQFAFAYLKNQMTQEEAKAMQRRIEEQAENGKKLLQKAGKK